MVTDWLNHPSYVQSRTRVITLFRDWALMRKELQPVIFLCGGKDSPQRIRLDEYLHKYHAGKLVFFAEKVWQYLLSFSNTPEGNELNALSVENELAGLADIVIVVVESPGTFTELGAFSLSDALRAKLLPILDRNFEKDPSFINTGPIKWINATSRFRPAIFGDTRAILTITEQLDDRLSRLPKRTTNSTPNVAESPKHLLLLLSDLVGLIGPAPIHHIQSYFGSIFAGQKIAWGLHKLMALAEAMNLIQRHIYFGPSGEHLTAFTRKVGTNEFLPAINGRIVNLANERARLLSVLMKIEESRRVIECAGAA